ncbi:unnamed protein product, partial [Mesorhabditis belari]|uniref:Uncharacterized protein n=1 Tax=Mesorhabditis belari TaxID=2138241 RepID=A0AAF3EME8_9BILA
MSDIDYPQGCGPILPEMKDSELLKKLKVMVDTFAKIDTGKGTTTHFRSLALHLIQDGFLNNNNREIQIYLANVLAEIFRINSPNNPYFRPDDIEKALSFMVNGLRGLENPDSTMYRRHVYLLENLLAMDTLRVIAELPEDPQQRTLRHVLKTSFEVAAKMKNTRKESPDENEEEMKEENSDIDGELPDEQDETQRILGIFIRLLSNALAEVPFISDKAMDVLFFYLIGPQRLNYPLAYQLSKKVVIISATALESPFQTMCTQAGALDRLPDDFELVGTKLAKLFEIICELYDISSKLVYPVLSLFMRYLMSDDYDARYKAVKLIGVLAVNDKGNLAEERVELWNQYLKRYTDISPTIRSLCATQGGAILLKHPAQRGVISKLLTRLLTDEDENVRIAAVSSTAQAAKKKIESVSDDLINAAAGRILDKKAKVRDEAIRQLVQVHAKLYKEDRYSQSDRLSVAIIAQKIFHIYSIEDMRDERLLIEKLFVGSIVPYRLSPERRVSTVVHVYSNLPPYEAEYFALLLSTQAKYRRAILDILLLAAQSNKSESPETLRNEIEKRIALTCHGQNSQAKYMNALRQFTNFISKDQHAFELVEYMVRPGYTCEQVEENTKEFLVRAAAKQAGERALTEEAVAIVKALFERSMPLQFDSATAKELCSYVHQQVRLAECSDQILSEKLPPLLQLWKLYAQHYAHCFAAESVAPLILDVARRVHCPPAVEAAMHVLQSTCNQNSVKVGEQSWCQDAVNVCTEITRNGAGRAAKRAVLCICRLLGQENARDVVLDIANSALTHLSIADPLCVTALQTLGRTVQAYPNEMREVLREKIRVDIVQDVLLTEVSEDDENPEAELVFDKCPPLIQRKISAIKYLVRFLLFTQNDDYDKPLVTKVVNCLVTFLEHQGDLHMSNTSSLEQAWSRAIAGSGLLRLCYSDKYGRQIPVSGLHLVARLLLDKDSCVRYYIARKIKKAIFRRALGVEFIGMYIVTPLVSDDERVKQIYEKAVQGKLDACLYYYKQLSLQKIVQDKLSFFQPELSLPYAIHFLSHSGYFNNTESLENLEEMIRCLSFLIDSFFRPNQKYDLDLALGLLQSVKDSVDASHVLHSDADKAKPDAPTKLQQIESRKMWILADFSMAMLAAKSKQQLSARPHCLKLSKRYFRPHEQNDNLWAPAQLVEQLRTGKWKRGRKGKGQNGSSLQSDRTSKMNGTKRGGKKRKAPKSEEESSEEEEENNEDLADQFGSTSLNNIVPRGVVAPSPIQPRTNTKPARTTRDSKTAEFFSSTPLIPKVKRNSRKAPKMEVDEENEISEEDAEKEQPSTSKEMPTMAKMRAKKNVKSPSMSPVKPSKNTAVIAEETVERRGRGRPKKEEAKNDDDDDDDKKKLKTRVKEMPKKTTKIEKGRERKGNEEKGAEETIRRSSRISTGVTSIVTPRSSSASTKDSSPKKGKKRR